MENAKSAPINYWEELIFGFNDSILQTLIDEVPWLSVQTQRHECFMSDIPRTYNYLNNGPVYQSIDFHRNVEEIRLLVNHLFKCNMNVCFLNYYENEHNALGWHADDAKEIDQTQPIIVISFGQPREIWWKPKDYKGVIPDEWKQLLGHCSCFVMSAGMQDTHFHRIPKGDRKMGPRISLTYRAFNGTS